MSKGRFFSKMDTAMSKVLTRRVSIYIASLLIGFRGGGELLAYLVASSSCEVCMESVT